MDESMDSNIPVGLRDCVCIAYAAIRQLDQGVNPVIKVPIIVNWVEERLLTDKLMSNDVEQQPWAGVVANAPPSQHTHQALMAQIHSQRLELAKLGATFIESFGANHVNMDRQFGMVNRNLRRIALATFRPVNRGAAVGNNIHDVGDNAGAVVPLLVSCTLSWTPRSLYDLWAEYEIGIGGRKAAKDFTAAERGRVKRTYHLRRLYWIGLRQEFVPAKWPMLPLTAFMTPMIATRVLQNNTTHEKG